MVYLFLELAQLKHWITHLKVAFIFHLPSQVLSAPILLIALIILVDPLLAFMVQPFMMPSFATFVIASIFVDGIAFTTYTDFNSAVNFGAFIVDIAIEIIVGKDWPLLDLASME